VAVREQWARGGGAPAGMAPAGPEPRRLLPPVQPRTMVEQAAEAIVAAAARGVFLPGDRLVEAEIARDLGISRVPVREALRLLESQGIVVSTPYKGMRLMQVTNPGVTELMRVRLALETLAVREAVTAPSNGPGNGKGRFAALRQAAEAFAQAAALRDPAALVAANEMFHAELCRASGNAPLLALWQSLARQLAVVWGLAQQQRDAGAAAGEHAAILAALEEGDAATAAAALTGHINWNQGCDFEALLDRRGRQPVA
jgi:DNA-binding GntR family transcriptional regulator